LATRFSAAFGERINEKTSGSGGRGTDRRDGRKEGKTAGDLLRDGFAGKTCAENACMIPCEKQIMTDQAGGPCLI